MNKIVSMILLMFVLAAANAQIKEPAKWTTEVKVINNEEVNIVFKATIEDKWHLYGQYFGEGGPMRAVFTFDKNANYTLKGKVLENPKPKEVYDDIFKMKVQYFDKFATFTQKIIRKNNAAFDIKVKLEYQVCNDIDGNCIPFFPEFDIKIPATDGAKKNETIDSLIIKNDSISDVVTNINSSENTSITPIEITKIEPITNEFEDMSLWNFFFISLLGGMIALLTPCIYPMIPMTVSYFMHNTESRKKAVIQAVFYGFSIIVIYLIIGTIVSLIFGESFSSWLSTHWLPNLMFFIIFLVFAASFFGMFELTLPSWIITKSDQNADKGGFVGAFFMAFTLVLVSFSCTAPVVGSILSFSAQGQVIKPIVGMLGFSLAFALPFTLFAIFPSWLKGLPKSGGWLNTVKVVLGFIELALSLKFLSVADQTYHWRLLDREVYLALWIAIFTLLGLYLLGKLKFHHDSDLPYLGVPRLMLAVITFSFVVYMIPGLFGAPLKALSGWIPPMSTQDFTMSASVNTKMDNEISKLCEKPKYADKLHLPYRLQGFFDYDQALACAKSQNKPVFVDFTGHGCVNCRKMEEYVWSDARILKRLNENYIMLALYVDDKVIKLPDNEVYTSPYDGKKITMLSEKNFDIQKGKYKSNGQPYYLLLNPDGSMLVPPRTYNLDIESFVDFLDSGIKVFEEKK